MELTAAEARVLGCLIEREALEPQLYPVSLDALRLGCNQAENRQPVVAYDDRTVEDTLLALKSKGLARFVDPPQGRRSARYRHRAGERWRLRAPELVVLAVLLVGGPLSFTAIEARARRLHDFGDAREIAAVLDTLAARTPAPFAARLDDGARGSETRWVEVLTGPPSPPGGAAGQSQAGVAHPAVVLPENQAPSYGELAARVAELERRLAVATERPAALAARAALPPGEPAGADRPSLAAVAERLVALERRLARVETELGALR